MHKYNPTKLKSPQDLVPGDVVLVARLSDPDDLGDAVAHMLLVVASAANDTKAVFLKELEDDGTVDSDVICLDLDKIKYAYLGTYKPVSWLASLFSKNLRPY